jgi:hypothetical protein
MTPPGQSAWSRRYGQRHRFIRVQSFPPGIAAPAKVRIYRRGDGWMLQWWEPSQRKNVAQRVRGDIITVISRAREIDQQLLDYKTSGQYGRRLKHRELAERFLADLEARADAGQIQPTTVGRYRSALVHYLAFAEHGPLAAKHPHAFTVTREFALALAKFLANRIVCRNGSATAASHRMKSAGLVLDTVRAMFQWAADPDRGNLLPQGFRNPFLQHLGDRSGKIIDPFGQPEITVAMAGQFLRECDDYQLRACE